MAAVPEFLPVFALPGLVLFPHADLPLRIYDPPSIRMIEAVMGGDRMLLICQARSVPGLDDDSCFGLYPVGTVAFITGGHRSRDGALNVFAHGVLKAEVGEDRPGSAYRVCSLRPLEAESARYDRTRVLARREEIVHRFYQAGALGILGPYPSGVLSRLENANDPNFVALAAKLLGLSADQQQQLLERCGIDERFQLLTEIFTGLLLTSATLGDTLADNEGEFSH